MVLKGSFGIDFFDSFRGILLFLFGLSGFVTLDGFACSDVPSCTKKLVEMTQPFSPVPLLCRKEITQEGKDERFEYSLTKFKPFRKKGTVLFFVPLEPDLATKIVMPKVESYIARSLCSQGFEVWVPRATPSYPNLFSTALSTLAFYSELVAKFHDPLYPEKRVAYDMLFHQKHLDRVLELAANEHHRNPFHSVHCLGISLGGLYCPIASEQYDWIDHIALAFAGGPAVEVLDSSSLPFLKTIKKLRLREYAHLRVPYIEMMRMAVHSDPNYSATHEKRDKVLFFKSDFDEVVPTRYQNYLRQHYGMPKTITYHLSGQIAGNYSHTVAIFRFAMYGVPEVAKFFGQAKTY